MPDSKARYAKFCTEGYVPIQFQPWWLDAVCGTDCWQVALAHDRSGTIVGAMPYYVKRRWGLKTIQLPPLTTYAGPWLRYPQSIDFKAVSRLSFEKKVMAELIRQLPRRVFFRQNFHPEITNWLPFYWENFRQQTRYTYVFENTDNLEKIRAGYKNTLRSDLKKAEKWVHVVRNDAAWEQVLLLNRQSFARKNRAQPYRAEDFENLHRALSSRAQSACFLAHDRQTGQASAGLYLVYDGKQASVLMTGTATALKHQNAICLLFEEGIRFCATQHLGLDFEGSMDKNIERFFRAYGAALVPYFQIWRWC